MTTIPKPQNAKDALENAIKVSGNKSALARAAGVTVQAVQTWHHIPTHHLKRLERVLGIPRSELRPDLFE